LLSSESIVQVAERAQALRQPFVDIETSRATDLRFMGEASECDRRWILLGRARIRLLRVTHEVDGEYLASETR